MISPLFSLKKPSGHSQAYNDSHNPDHYLNRARQYSGSISNDWQRCPIAFGGVFAYVE
jgi:hypothetical protein